ncbi:hypothetical protein C9374_007284 [Naegleria lovaniensis]|uniref:Ion transport domain-containing protein n=1 Tax=Naegleria lovaniensis TaxID=51637 RepID=A0AA88GZ91_NAELO|nr:uncharacterized protein C9374_007284 [Naegleria lovaniensis]KAG2393753.1 hypothetical protein C9374_007284 [Naegleria lovaniensis]
MNEVVVDVGVEDGSSSRNPTLNNNNKLSKGFGSSMNFPTNTIETAADDGEPTTSAFAQISSKKDFTKEEKVLDDTTPARGSVDIDRFMESHSRLFRSRRTIAIINSIPKNSADRSWRQKMYLILEHPRSSYVAMIVTIISSLMTVIQTVCLVLRSFPFFFQFEFLWIFITGFLSIYFMIEYILRMVAYVHTWGDFRHFVTGGMNIIDFMSWSSFWIDLILYEADLSDHFYAQTLTVFRILRLLKLIKLTRLSAKFQLLVVSIRRSFELLLSLVVLTVMGAIISSTLIYYAERGLFDAKSGTWLRPDGTPSPFSNIMVCMWFSIVSLATVGYGDITPVTVTGRIIAVMTILSGIVVMALPSMAIGGIYSKLLAEFDAAQDETEEKEKQKESEDMGIDLDIDEAENAPKAITGGVMDPSQSIPSSSNEQKSTWLSVDELLFGSSSSSNNASGIRNSSSFGDLGDWSNLKDPTIRKDLQNIDEGILTQLIQQQELLMQACVQQMTDMKLAIEEMQLNRML